MRIEEFIERDKKEGILGIYRVVDQDISVGMIRTGVNMTSYVIDCDIRDMLDKMGVDAYYSVFDIRNVLWVNKDAKNWIKSPMAAQVVKGYAIIAETPISSLLADLWVTLNNLPFPVRKFSNFENGLKWIKELKAEDERMVNAQRA